MKEKVQKVLIFVVKICVISKIFSFQSFVHMKEKVQEIVMPSHLASPVSYRSCAFSSKSELKSLLPQ